MQAARATPSQAPPHEVPSEEQAARPPWGAPTTGEQVPAFPGRLQDSHWPLHAPPQQTPSAQTPVAHWFAPPQTEPAGFWGTQLPALHQFPAAQSASATQVAPQAVAWQA